ncbi:MAG: hypothetical protein ABEH65_01230 [Halobacteriales archaeon]
MAFDLLTRLDAFFTRFTRPWLAAVAAAGGVWLVLSFPIGFLGSFHPLLNYLGIFLHFLGLGTLLASGVIFAVLWWKQYINKKFFSG